MSSTVILKEQGTNCVVYCPDADGHIYIPATLTQTGNTGEEVVLIAREAPQFQTEKEAWAYHLGKLGELVAALHDNINQQYEVPLHVVAKRAGKNPPISISEAAWRYKEAAE